MTEPKLVFKPYIVQNGSGPHLDKLAYATDVNGDTFHSNISVEKENVTISDTEGIDKFAITVRWNVEGYGYLRMPADNGGEFYELPPQGQIQLNLNFELAKTRINRNRSRAKTFEKDGWEPSRELQSLVDLSDCYFNDAQQVLSDEAKCGQLSQKTLTFALWASELLEIEKAKFDVQKNGYRPNFLVGCDGRGFFQMNQDLFLERFSELFNYATITHYLIGDIHDFEPEEGKRNFKERDALLKKLRERDIIVAGRPLFWTHKWVTPEWLKKKSFAQLLHYLERHIKEVIKHYGDEIQVWEVVNELHDWANELELNHEQTIELTKLACDIARASNPKIKLLINNCCPFAEYVQKGFWHERQAKYPQRTPVQFTQQLIDAGVDFDILGLQMYFTGYTLADTFHLFERYEKFGKTIHIAEIGCPSWGIAQEFNEADKPDFSNVPYEWHRLWDEVLQADWLEAAFNFAYSKPYIEAANWYDFIDPYCFLKHGGLLRSSQGEKKAAFFRLQQLQQQWKSLTSITN